MKLLLALLNLLSVLLLDTPDPADKADEGDQEPVEPDEMDPATMDRNNLDGWVEAMTGLLPSRDDPEAIAKALKPFGSFGAGIVTRYGAIESEQRKAKEDEERETREKEAEEAAKAAEAAKTPEERAQEEAAQGAVDLQTRLKDLRQTPQFLKDFTSLNEEREANGKPPLLPGTWEEKWAGMEEFIAAPRALADIIGDPSGNPAGKVDLWEASDPVVREQAVQLFNIVPPFDLDVDSEDYATELAKHRQTSAETDTWIRDQLARRRPT